MKKNVEAELARVEQMRRGALQGMNHELRLRVLESLLVDFVFNQGQLLIKWAALTGQTAQIDSGYAAQHVASIITGEPGQGFRGKGNDLADGSEVKSAAALSGVDRPRWNHNLGTKADDAKRLSNSELTKLQKYLAAPAIFYMLIDHVFDTTKKSFGDVRVRGWLVIPAKDRAWRALTAKWADERSTGTYNFQLHPPVGYDDNLVVNTLGNLDFADTLVFDARLSVDPTGPSASVNWVKNPPASVSGWRGRTAAVPYAMRPSRLGDAALVVIPVDGIRDVLPPEYADVVLGMVTLEVEALTD